MSKIQQALSKVFSRHRIVFWYDAKEELRSDFESLELPEVEKIELKNNEFSTKYRILKEEPERKFLLYHEGPQPDDLDNWLLDVQLTHGEFRTDQAAIWLSELELGLEFTEIVQTHMNFFTAIKRREELKKLLTPDDTGGMIRLKMLAVCANSGPRMDEILENLLSELADERDEKIRLIQRCSLESFLWEQLKRFYGYVSETPGIHDFLIELFKSCYAMGTDGEIRLTNDALVFLKRWKDSIRHHQAFEKLSEDCAEFLNVENDLQQKDFRNLIDIDYFKLIDQRILSDLVKSVADRTISVGDCAVFVRQRRQSHWYRDFQDLYEAVDYSARFMHALDEASLSSESITDGVTRYCRSWYRIDQLYRKFLYHVRKSGQTSLMGELADIIENLYTNTYLLKVNDAWQSHVDAVDKWEAQPIPSQRSFFAHWVQPFLKNNKKVYIIISDALRFEVGEELLGLIRKEDRYDAEIKPVLSMLPSYTQLGMASLLPNKELAFSDDGSGTVLVDGQSSQGTVNRAKILSQAISQKATAIKADDLLALNLKESRELTRDHDVIYVYHNRIDAIGDKRDSEERTVEAVEDALLELIRVIKKLTGANANNLLVTSDHGFIYQNRAIEDSDYSGADVQGEQVLHRDRRFVLGRGLAEQDGLRKFHASQVGLQGDMELQIPKSINRLRLKGSGSRYVHGGASLQEVIVPVIQINKKRQSDITAVDVDILRGATSVITSGQLSVVFYQKQPTSDKVQPRMLRAGIYTQAGELISDSHDLSFDLFSENAREREFKVRFVLTSKADDANGQEVTLRLDEQLPGTSHFREYSSVRYVMRRSFTSDFEF